MGNSMLLVCVDGFSKFVWLLPVREATTASTIRELKQGVFASYSVPEIIVSDNAKCFVSDEFRRFCFSLGIQRVTTTPYYPNPSHAERFNRNLPPLPHIMPLLIRSGMKICDGCRSLLIWLFTNQGDDAV
jgi:transposase InsO family protein